MTGQAELQLAVWVEDVWARVPVAAAPDWPLERVKEEALREAVGAAVNPTLYEVKFRGVLVSDEGASLTDLRIPNRAALAVLPTARRPAR
jgi:hypothetical protein